MGNSQSSATQAPVIDAPAIEAPAIEAPAIEAKGLSKRFGAVQANDAIALKVRAGTCHGIVGENGAGKSTLLKMLFGFYQPDSGTIWVHGIERALASPADAMAAGIGMVHQHFMLVEPFTVLENIILGAEGSASLAQAAAAARPALVELEQKFGFDVPLDAVVDTLPVGTKQRVEILKAMYRGADILILDEPTAVLTPPEAKQLFALIKMLQSEGKTVLFVTHKLDEIMAVTDHVTVIRAGRVVGDMATATTDAAQLAETMVGKRITRAVIADTSATETAALLRISGLSTDSNSDRPGPQNISLDVHAGEILGIAGVAGNGQSELLEALIGTRALSAGELWIADEKIADASGGLSPLERRAHMGMVAEDRLRAGVVETMSGAENAILGYHRRPAFEDARGLLRREAIAETAARYFEDQDVRPRDPSLPVGKFSGGNQQKLVMVREFAHAPKVMIIGQPTRGVDIGAVTRIHDQLTALRNQGTAVLVVSADLDELLAISDRIAVMADGKIVGIVDRADASEQKIGLMMAGLSQHQQPEARHADAR